MTPLPKIAAPAQRALAAAKIAKLEDLGRYTETGVAALHGMVPNALGRLKAAMKDAGISFRT